MKRTRERKHERKRKKDENRCRRSGDRWERQTKWTQVMEEEGRHGRKVNGWTVGRGRSNKEEKEKMNDKEKNDKKRREGKNGNGKEEEKNKKMNKIKKNKTERKRKVNKNRWK